MSEILATTFWSLLKVLANGMQEAVGDEDYPATAYLAMLLPKILESAEPHLSDDPSRTLDFTLGAFTISDLSEKDIELLRYIKDNPGLGKTSVFTELKIGTPKGGEMLGRLKAYKLISIDTKPHQTGMFLTVTPRAVEILNDAPGNGKIPALSEQKPATTVPQAS